MKFLSDFFKTSLIGGLFILLPLVLFYLMLDQLLGRPIESGDVLSNANTIILMGKVREGLTMGRALYVAKHRGSPCDETIVPFDVSPNHLGFDEYVDLSEQILAAADG